MKTSQETLEALIQAAVAAGGCELYGCQMTNILGRPTIQVLIEGLAGCGATVDDCSRVTRQIQAQMAVEDQAWLEHYDLEVSTPGIDRPLLNAAHFMRYVGRGIEFRLYQAYEGRRNFKGQLMAASDETVQVLVEDKLLTFKLNEIEKAKLVLVI